MAFYIAQGDTLPVLNATLLQNGVAIDLTGSTVKFQLTQNGVVAFSSPATIVSAVAGTVRYSWVAGDTATVGPAKGVFKITSGADKLTVPNTAGFDVVIT